MLNDLVVRLRALVFRRSIDRELEEEMRFHLDRDAERYRAAGLTSPDALVAAKRDFGNMTVTIESARDEWRWSALERFAQDASHTIRMLRRNPAFTITAVLCLTLGIGATTAIFSIVNAVLIRPLPYPNADRIAYIWASSPVQPRMLMSIPDVYDLRARNRTFDALGVERTQSVNVTGREAPDRVTGSFVSASALTMMGARTALGRLFQPDETEPGTGQPLVVMSYGMWQTRYAGDSSIIGRALVLNGRPHTVIGVTAKDFADAFVPTTSVWLPITSAPSPSWFTRGNPTVWAIGRVKAGLSAREAGDDLARVGAQLAAENPAASTGFHPNVVPLRDMLVRDIRPMLLTVLGFVTIVLLIACTNVANLQLARATVRARELSVRAALGADHGRLVRQLLTESIVLSSIGGMLGVLAARLGVRALVAAIPGGLPVPVDVGLDPTVLADAAFTTIAAGVAFGLAPALHAARPNLFSALTTRSEPGARRFDVRQVLVGLELALSIVLLVGAGLFLRSLTSLERVNPGFATDHLMTAQLRLPSSKYSDSARIVSFMTKAASEIRAVPGVRSAALVSATPLSGNWGQISYVVAGTPELAAAERPVAIYNTVSGDYFRTMQIPMISGRDFDERDRAGSPPVVIVNDVLAARAWPNEDAIGKQLVLAGPPRVQATVIAVVKSVKHLTLTDGATAQIYDTMAQSPGIFTSIVARTRAAPDSLGPAIRAAVWKVDRDQPVWSLHSMEWWYQSNVAAPRFSMRLTSAFAILALALAAVGVYGVMAFAVAQRTREVGLRMALGATRRKVVQLVLERAGKVILVASVVGLIAAYVAAQFIRRQLFGIGTLDVMTYVSVPLVLVFVAFVASLLPALRAARVDPAIALSAD